MLGIAAVEHWPKSMAEKVVLASPRTAPSGEQRALGGQTFCRWCRCAQMRVVNGVVREVSDKERCGLGGERDGGGGGGEGL